MLGFDPSQPGPDFEAPAGSQGNTYQVTVRAVDSQQAVTDYAVTVTNIEEEGRVDLSPTPPRVDEARTATLMDPDGSLSATDWQWQGRAPGSTAWTAVSEPATDRRISARATVNQPVRVPPQPSYASSRLRPCRPVHRARISAGMRANVSGQTGWWLFSTQLLNHLG